MPETLITRGRACAIIRQADRLLLNRFGGDSFWALPGGAIESGEFSTEALVREMREELASRSRSAAWSGWSRTCSNTAAPSTRSSASTTRRNGSRLPPGIGDEEFVGEEPDQFFRWVRYDEIAALDFRPTVLRLPLLAHLSGAESAAPLHFLHKD